MTENPYIDPKEILESIRSESEFRKVYLNEWVENIEPAPLLIVAKDYRQASLYARLNSIPTRLYKYVRDENDLRGIYGSEIRLITGYRQNERIHEIEQVIGYLKQSNRAVVVEVEW